MDSLDLHIKVILAIAQFLLHAVNSFGGWGLEHVFGFAPLSPSNYDKNKKPFAYVLNIIYIILSTTHILYIIINYKAI